MSRVPVQWCDGIHGKQCRDRPHRVWRLMYCVCPCHDRPAVLARWQLKVLALALIFAAIVTVIALEWHPGTHGLLRHWVPPDR